MVLTYHPIKDEVTYLFTLIKKPIAFNLRATFIMFLVKCQTFHAIDAELHSEYLVTKWLEP